ncbi:hypothetical protein R1sor_024979 [Riccia sorocarpa]|uniref:Stress regulated protein n=1 Tax=Riccia sorocarpa TaxID=122646 RepID=A0ABD3G8T3_9MARC
MAQASMSYIFCCNAHSVPLLATGRFLGRRFAGGAKEVKLSPSGGKYRTERWRVANVARASMEDFLKVEGTKKVDVNSRVWLSLIDAELQRGNEKQALELAKQLPAFGAAQLVPQRAYTLEELRLNKIEAEKFLSPVDKTLGSVRGNIQLAAVLLGVSVWRILDLNQFQLLGAVLLFLFLGTVDQVVNGGGVEGLLLDTVGRLLSKKYRERVAKHEAGHFLVAYLMGFMPKSYTLSSLDAFQRFGALNVQAGTTFIDFEFQAEVESGKVSSGTLDKVSCIALAGVATEYLVYGVAEGGVADINQLDGLMKILGFTQRKADSQVRWAVLNTVSILRRHLNLHSKLADYMTAGKSVLECVGLIEEELANCSNI